MLYDFQDALTSLNPTMNIGRQIEENITNHYKVTKKKQGQRQLKCWNW